MESNGLPRILVADVVAAVVSGAFAAPFVAAVDRSVAECAGGKASIWGSLRGNCHAMLNSPLAYLRQPAFRYLWALYVGTYSVANLFMSFEELQGKRFPLAKTGCIFVTAAGLSSWKDAAFAKMFSTKPPGPVPYRSLVSWWLRDFIGLGCIFVAAPALAERLHQQLSMSKESAYIAAQLAVPILQQPVIAPLALYGFVVYNYPCQPWSHRMAIMRREVANTTMVRTLRIFPPYCVGGIINRKVRQALREDACGDVAKGCGRALKS